MKFKSLQIFPQGEHGWGLPLLEFGEDITQLYGPNGCGKTPVIHSIAFALGYPVKFRDDINARCKKVELNVIHDGQNITITREFTGNFDVDATCRLEGKKEAHTFYNERDLSRIIFEIIGISTSTLTTTKNTPTAPYISGFLPLFYVDQDTGYTQPYRARSSFIKDQYAEMVRLALGIPPKHAYELKKALIKLKGDLNNLNTKVVAQRDFIETTIEGAGTLRSLNEINRNIESLTFELEELRKSQDASNDVDIALRVMINERALEERNLKFKARDIEDRILGFSKISDEIEQEIEALSLNEESRRLFASFEEICSNQNCQLFVTSTESFGKNLLYLKDQIKDLDHVVESLKSDLDGIIFDMDNVSAAIEELKLNLDSSSKDNSINTLVNTISKLTKSLIDLQRDKETAERIAQEKSVFAELLSQRENVNNDIAAMEGGGGNIDVRIIEFKRDYKQKVIRWLDILQTHNVNREIKIDSDFGILFGDEQYSQFSGSTLLRVVLAMRAAFFDLYISKDLGSLNFLIFDTPKQHDIETEHFGAFINELKNLVSGTDYQIVFSTTEYHYETNDSDKEWTPLFPGDEQLMFLGETTPSNG